MYLPTANQSILDPACQTQTFTPRKSIRLCRQTWKVTEAGSWDQFLRNAAPSNGNRRRRRRKPRESKSSMQIFPSGFNHIINSRKENRITETQIKAQALPPNKYLDKDNDIILPSVNELLSMDQNDRDEVYRAVDQCQPM
jgi:hypothetical protein